MSRREAFVGVAALVALCVTAGPPASRVPAEWQGLGLTEPDRDMPDDKVAVHVKAEACVRLACAELGREAAVARIEDRALELMFGSDADVIAALRRLPHFGADLFAVGFA